MIRAIKRSRTPLSMHLVTLMTRRMIQLISTKYHHFLVENNKLIKTKESVDQNLIKNHVLCATTE